MGRGGDAAGITADGLIAFSYSLPAPYRTNATWVMNSQTAAAIALLKDGNGSFIWREGLAAGAPSTLLGRPVELCEDMPGIAPGATPIAYGDWKAGYLINDRLGTSVLRDPFSSKPFVLFYARKRVGGGVRDPRALRVLRVGT